MRRLRRINVVDRGRRRLSVAWRQDDIYQTLDQFAERLYPVTNQEGDEIVKQVGRDFRICRRGLLGRNRRSWCGRRRWGGIGIGLNRYGSGRWRGSGLNWSGTH